MDFDTAKSVTISLFKSIKSELGVDIPRIKVRDDKYYIHTKFYHKAEAWSILENEYGGTPSHIVIQPLKLEKGLLGFGVPTSDEMMQMAIQSVLLRTVKFMSIVCALDYPTRTEIVYNANHKGASLFFEVEREAFAFVESYFSEKNNHYSHEKEWLLAQIYNNFYNDSDYSSQVEMLNYYIENGLSKYAFKYYGERI